MCQGDVKTKQKSENEQIKELHRGAEEELGPGVQRVSTTLKTLIL